MTGREQFTDHEGNEAPDFEVEEEEEKKPSKPPKSEKEEDEEEFEDEDEEPKKSKKSDDDDDEEEEEEDPDDEKEQLRAENEGLKQEALKALHDKTEGERDQAKYLVNAIDKQIESLRNNLVEAKKDEDVEKQAKIENDLEKAKDAKGQAETLVKEADQRLQQLKSGGQSGGDGYRTPKARAWASKNRWLNEPGYDVERAAVIAIDQQLAKEGKNPNTDGYFKEMTKRLAKKLPGLKVVNLDGTRPVTSKRKPGGDGRKSPHTSAGTSGTQHKQAPGKPRFEPADRAKMRKWGLDPDNKNDVKHWLQSKAETAAQEARDSE